MKNVLITGVASGIGASVADIFAENGYNVYGIDVSEIHGDKGIVSYKADITNEGALSAIADHLRSSGISLDLIINVAGIHRMTSLVEGDYSKMKRLVDINLSGTMLVNHVFHSLLKENGRIIIVTSEVAGLDPMPFNGLYTLSKTALESYAQALRQELNLLGQRVITIRPGAIETPLSAASMTDTARLAENTQLYSDQAKRFSSLAAKFMGKPIKPQVISRIVYHAATTERPKPVYKKHHNLGLVLLNLLPLSWQCAIIKLLLNN